MKCPNCGAQIPEGSSQCPHCDGDFAAQKENSQEQQEVIYQNSAAGTAVETDENTEKPVAPIAPPPVQPQKKKKKGYGCLLGIIVSVIGAVIAMIMIAVMIMAVIFGSSESQTESEPSEEINTYLQGSEDEEMIAWVKKGSPYLIPDITYEEAYENFFGNPTWRYFDADDGSEVVEFAGECTYNDEPAEIYIQFVLDPDDDSFEMHYANLEVEGEQVEMDGIILLQLIYNPFSEYAENIRKEPLSEDIERQFDEAYWEILGLEQEQGKEQQQEQEQKDTYADETNDVPENPYMDSVLLWKSFYEPLTEEDLSGLSADELRIARNEIYAAYGRQFSSNDLQNYFAGKSWYEGNIPASQFSDSVLTEIQKDNIALISSYENGGSGDYSSRGLTFNDPYAIPQRNGTYLYKNIDPNDTSLGAEYLQLTVSRTGVRCILYDTESARGNASGYDGLESINDQEYHTDEDGGVSIIFDDYGKYATVIFPWGNEPKYVFERAEFQQ